MEINGNLIKEPLERICNNNNLTSEELVDTIRSIPQGVIPYTLDKWNIPKDQLPKLADESFTKGRMDNNIVNLSKEDVIDIFRKIY